MPRSDQTGPSSAGLRTGRGLGPCGQADRRMDSDSGASSRGVGKGGLAWGGGRGQCFGGRNRWFPVDRQASTESSGQVEALRNEIAVLREELAAMEARLGELGDPK